VTHSSPVLFQCLITSLCLPGWSDVVENDIIRPDPTKTVKNLSERRDNEVISESVKIKHTHTHTHINVNSDPMTPLPAYMSIISI